jgi:hypothetical protein
LYHSGFSFDTIPYVSNNPWKSSWMYQLLAHNPNLVTIKKAPRIPEGRLPLGKQYPHSRVI